ncbi:MAG: hypothetical protein ACXW0T_10620 [Methylobacter sp.]
MTTDNHMQMNHPHENENITETEKPEETPMQSGIEVNIIDTLFNPGQVVATPGALDVMQTNNCLSLDLLMRHLTGDWGVIPQEDAQANQQAVENGLRILSSYPQPNGARIWVITEADRSSTTFLLPEEY